MSDSEKTRTLIEEFAERREARWKAGMEEYGDDAWRYNSMLEYAIEEVLDAANYLERLYVKLRYTQETLKGLAKAGIYESGINTANIATPRNRPNTIPISSAAAPDGQLTLLQPLQED